ncbi:MAG: hypothetical protein NC092_08065 [Butyrivibrio sp.]|nr:hypothetical protein [Muribaculum sp.]MCM1552630.1 hypothetical protein [Butyrivibrio sp.]
MKKNGIAILAVCAAMGWWGALYPRFTLLESTYEIVYENETEEASESHTDTETGSAVGGSELYWKILDADCSQIRFKSRLLTEWAAYAQK